MIRPHHLGDASIFLGQSCALCKQEFASGDDIVVCPEDGSRHHVHCWQANNNHCTAYGCRGEGIIGVAAAVPTASTPEGEAAEAPARPPTRSRVVPLTPPPPPPPRRRPGAARPIPNAPGSKVRTLPAGNFGCLRGCIIAALVLVILMVGLACAGAFFFTTRTSVGEALPLLRGLVALITLRLRPS